jgi:hypothetical protein
MFVQGRDDGDKTTDALTALGALLHTPAVSASPLLTAGVRLADGRVFRGRTIISNATRWDTFEGMMGESNMPESEKLFRCVCMLCFSEIFVVNQCKTAATLT